MILPILFALAGGTLVGISRSINGRISSTNSVIDWCMKTK